MNIVIKKGTAKEMNFFLSSWVRTYQGTMEAELWKDGVHDAAKNFHAYITKLFSNPDTEVLYVGDDETDEIYSYAVFNSKESLLYFVYTKSTYRRSKFADKLLSKIEGFEFPLIYNKAAKDLAQKYGFKFNPEKR